jgi:glycosyltransferase involved in cell wall biosynthesis
MMTPNEHSNKTILMACTQPYWSSLQLGSQHFARQFADHGWRVHYFSAPVTFLHFFKYRSYEVRKRLHQIIGGPRIHHNNSIYTYIPFSLIAPSGLPILRSRHLIFRWYKTLIPSIRRQLQKHSINRVQLLYVDNIFFHFFFNMVNYQKSIFRVMDEHHHFYGWNINAKILAKDIAKKCDTLIYSAQALEPYVSQLKPERSFLIPNGVDLSLFKNSNELNRIDRHYLLKDIPDPIILYSGMIDSRLDFRLLQACAVKNPTISFVFIGPFGENAQPNNLPKNIHFIGPVSHKELPLLMYHAKAGIIPFDTINNMKRIRGIRPLKLFEYMAAGIPVITSRWPEIESLNSPAWIYDSEEDFIRLVNRAANHSYNPSTFTTFAEKHDWKKRFAQLMNHANLT